jgi:glycosyltransferase involved in cell wall biosynthesis
MLDKLITNSDWDGILQFTYIGNTSNEYILKNSNIIEPLSGIDLAKNLSQNDIYLTGSINEPSGNHHIEAALCGLPVLYLNSGGIPEYCDGYGVSYNNLDEFEDKLKIIIKEKDKYEKNLENYHFDSENMNKEYLELFESLVLKKKEASKNFKTPRKAIYLFRFKIRKLTRNFSQVNLRIRMKKLLRI